MKIISVNVGLPRPFRWRDQTVFTAIFKEPVPGPVRVERLNLVGDRQADLRVHGGVDKAVYAYPAEHYGYWREELPGEELPCGSFGENLTTRGLLEDSVHIGDRLVAGTAEFMVTQPRMPCYKLGIRFGRPDMVKRFLQSGRTGFYLAVLREGEVAAGDDVAVLARYQPAISIAEIVSLYTNKAADQAMLRKASRLPALPEGWRDYFRQLLWDPDG